MKIIIQIILILLIGYNAFRWYVEIQSEKENIPVKKEVIFVACNTTKASNIQIIHQLKKMTIEIPSNICRQISEGDKIELIYDKLLNDYHYPGSNSSRNISVFFLVIFGISFINFKKLKPL